MPKFLAKKWAPAEPTPDRHSRIRRQKCRFGPKWPFWAKTARNDRCSRQAAVQQDACDTTYPLLVLPGKENLKSVDKSKNRQQKSAPRSTHDLDTCKLPPCPTRGIRLLPPTPPPHGKLGGYGEMKRSIEEQGILCIHVHVRCFAKERV